jgi:hypothetical protein
MNDNYKVPQYDTPSIRPYKQPSKQPCEHKWVYQGSDYYYSLNGVYNGTFKKIDTYYCEKCLEIKEIVTKEEDCTGRPYWYKG